MIFQKPPTIDIDAWEKLGSPGWDWAHYDAAIKKTEAYVPVHEYITLLLKS